MTVFEKIAASPEKLGNFLASLAVIDAPWEDAFHKVFCTECGRDNCDEKRCPFQKERDNPTWWLRLGKQAEDAKSTQRDTAPGYINLELVQPSNNDILQKQLELLAEASSGKLYNKEGKPEPIEPEELASLTAAMCRVVELMQELYERTAGQFQAMRRAFVTDTTEREKRK